MSTWVSPGPGCAGRSKGAGDGNDGPVEKRQSIYFCRVDTLFHQPQGTRIILQLFVYKGCWGEPALAIATKTDVVLNLMEIIHK